MSKFKGNKYDYQLLKRVLKLALPYKSIFIWSAILAIVIAPLAVMRPFLISKIVDDYIFKYDIPGLTKMVILFIVVLSITVVLRYFFIYATNLLGQNIIRDLRIRVFNHISSLNLSFFDKTPIGTATTRTINDIETINTVFSQGIITIIADLLGLIAVLVIMFISSWKLTLICLTTMPLIIISTYIFKEKVKTSFQTVRTQISKMNAFLQERITGMRIIQIFNAEEKEMAKFKDINKEYTQANLNAILYYAIFFPVVEIISALSLAIMVWWGAKGILDDSVTLGALVAFPIYLGMLFRPMRMLADKFNTLQMGLVAADRVFAILDLEDKISNKEGGFKPDRLNADIVFKNVHFAYLEDNYVLKDVSFKINAGETLAIVGGTGSGKTTVINLLNRFYEIQKGQILIDGRDVSDYDLSALRKCMAIVLQDVFLFTGTVMENITLRNKDFDKEKVYKAAKDIGAHEFFEQLPDAYDHVVMERGANLSMGQRQLISFVRALVFDPDILILDEATSSIDTETEAVIQFAIETLIEKRTSIIIAHRLSTIRHANNIMVMHLGENVEFGPHEELLKKEDGFYKALYEMQLMGETTSSIGK
jgi:ATP-binding cassette subfamily B protein